LLAVVHPGLHAALGLAGRSRVGLGGHVAGQPLAVGSKVGTLGLDHLARFAGAHLAGHVGAGYRQHGTGLEAVHVVAGKGLRVAAVERHQHLVERHPSTLTRVPAMRDRESPCADTVLVVAHAVTGAAGAAAEVVGVGHSGLARGSGAADAPWAPAGPQPLAQRPVRRPIEGAVATERARRWRRRRQARARRVEQHRVFAHQAAGGPRSFEDHVDEGLEHRAIAGDTQHTDGRRHGAAAFTCATASAALYSTPAAR
jgi:hypothetical protein